MNDARVFELIALAMIYVGSSLVYGEQQSEFIKTYCVRCHGENDSEFDLTNLSDPDASKESLADWVRVFDRVSSGEMPPADEPAPSVSIRNAWTDKLSARLESASRVHQAKRGRVPERRLTRTEFEHAVNDLLHINTNLLKYLPEESKQGTFDTVGAAQSFSAMHLNGYLQAADHAMDVAIRMDRNPFRSYDFDLLGNALLNSFHERDLQVGGNISRKLNDGVVIFRDVDYLLRSDLHGFRVKRNGFGRYEIRICAEAYQCTSPVCMKVVVKDISGEAKVVGAFDLLPGHSRTVTVEAYLERTKVFYVSLDEEQPPAQILADIFDAGGAKAYPGRGIKVNSIRVEGPIADSWPPLSTRNVFPSATFSETESAVEMKVENQGETLRDTIDRIATQA